MFKIAPIAVKALVALFAVAAGSSLSHAQDKESKPMILFETDKGSITVELDSEKAPGTVANFLDYVDQGFFDGLVFHRVIPGFMVQGGGFEPGMKMRQPTRPNIQNEAANGLENDRGTIAMARTGDPHSASSQFFINLVDNDFLNYPGADGWGYAVFGKVVSGMEAVDAMAAVETGRHGAHGDVPKEDIRILRAVRADAAEKQE